MCCGGAIGEAGGGMDVGIGRSEVLEGVSGVGDAVEARLVVDRRHPFFFDHPLDHVPGLLLIEGMVRTGEAAMERQGVRGRTTLRDLQVEFRRYCVFDRPVTLLARAAGEGAGSHGRGYSIEVWQQGVLRASGRCGWVATESLPLCADRPATAEAGPTVTACAANRVRKQRPENVMIGQPREVDDMLVAPVLAPHPDNRLARGLEDEFSAIYLLEAFMQTQRYLNGRETRSGAVPRMRDALTGVSIRLAKRIGLRSGPLMARPLEGIDPARTGRRTQRGVVCRRGAGDAFACDRDDLLAECVMHSTTVA